MNIYLLLHIGLAAARTIPTQVGHFIVRFMCLSGRVSEKFKVLNNEPATGLGICSSVFRANRSFFAQK